MHTDVLVVGGGLSGLALADRLSRAGVDYLLVEARDRLGGRILTHTVTGPNGDAGFDLGPAWFWPGQPRMARMLEKLGLSIFEQYARGDILSEDSEGRVRRGSGFESMQGSYRVAGGLSTLIGGLQNRLDPKRVLSGRPVTAIAREDAILRTEVLGPEATKQWITSAVVVLAVPPRIAAESIVFGQELSPTALDAMRRVPTWMAGQAKIVAIYERPFWREAGLSGDAMSRAGPMAEIHDSSPENGGPYGLFGFVGFPADVRLAHKTKMMELAKDQLVRLFGSVAADPMRLILRDWAAEPFTATRSDWSTPGHHPAYGLPSALADLWNGRLIMGSTEVAVQFGGLLEGALEASEAAMDSLNARMGLESSSQAHTPDR